MSLFSRGPKKSDGIFSDQSGESTDPRPSSVGSRLSGLFSRGSPSPEATQDERQSPEESADLLPARHTLLRQHDPAPRVDRADDEPSSDEDARDHEHGQSLESPGHSPGVEAPASSWQVPDFDQASTAADATRIEADWDDADVDSKDSPDSYPASEPVFEASAAPPAKRSFFGFGGSSKKASRSAAAGELPAAPASTKPKSKKSKPKKGAALPPSMVVRTHGSSAGLVFGIKWASVISGGGQDMALARAKREKSTHFIYRNHQIGLTALPDVAPELPVYSAARQASKLTAATAIFLLPLTGQAYWLALVRSGQPTSTDEILDGVTSSQALDRARDLASQFEGETITLFTPLAFGGEGFARVSEQTVEDLLEAVLAEEDRLTAVPKAQKKTLFVALGLLVLGGGALLGQQYWTSYRAKEAQRLRDLQAAQQVSPEQAWGDAIKQFFSAAPIPTGSLAPLFRAVSSLPVSWEGWTLKTADCRWSADIQPGSGRQMSCTAEYARTAAGALVEDFVPIVKLRIKDAVVARAGLSGLSVSFGSAVSWPSFAASGRDVPLLDQADLGVVSRLQRYAPVLAEIATLDFKPAAIRPPAGSDGQSIPPPPSVPSILTADVRVKAPLRTIEVLAVDLPSVDWNSLRVSYVGADAIKASSARSSSLMADLSGTVIAKRVSASPPAAASAPVAVQSSSTLQTAPSGHAASASSPASAPTSAAPASGATARATDPGALPVAPAR